MMRAGLEAEKKKPDRETLRDSTLYQFAYLERLLSLCKDQKNPRSQSQMIISGKDREFNGELRSARELVD